MEAKNIEIEAKEIIEKLLSEGLDLESIKNAFSDGSYLTETGYTDDDQELIEEIDALIIEMLTNKK